MTPWKQLSSRSPTPLQHLTGENMIEDDVIKEINFSFFLSVVGSGKRVVYPPKATSK